MTYSQSNCVYVTLAERQIGLQYFADLLFEHSRRASKEMYSNYISLSILKIININKIP